MALFRKKEMNDDRSDFTTPEQDVPVTEDNETNTEANVVEISADGTAAEKEPLDRAGLLRMILSIIGAAVLVIGCIFFASRAAALASENSDLDARLQRDQKLQKNESQYEAQTSELNSDTEDMIDRYSAGNTPEKTIMFLVNLSNSSGISVNAIEFGEEENVTVDASGNPIPGAQKAPDPTSPQEDSSASDDRDSGTGSSSGSGSSSSSSGLIATASAATDEDPEASSEKEDSSSTQYYLYRYPVTFSYTGSYADLKEAVDFIENYGERMTINDITSTYDETTSQLTGSITLNMYTMTGTDKSYTEPQISGSSIGTSEIFG